MSKRISAPSPEPITRKQVARFLPKRPRDSHKGMFGTVAVIGGNAGMIGAALLAARAAHRLGAGCVHAGLLAGNAPGVDMLQPELMLHCAAEAVQLPGVDVLAVGCGLGRDLAAQKLLHDALHSPAALVLDADALNILALRPDLRGVLVSRKSPGVATPHPGEAARLLACSTEQVQADRVAAALKLAQKLRCSVVLKGANSLCATSDGKLFVNQTGNAGMSSAGMGDVLTGMIAAFVAQGVSGDEAMLLAVHLHGAAGDALAQQQATIGMTGTEVTEWARWLLNQWLYAAS
ncbi:MAG: NAD(P)H-hydrate dehydratase [Nitrosomonadales bacterium]|nr:NAD(P)H-hydrate dehydratase [Nitrosomonadales bacterium]